MKTIKTAIDKIIEILVSLSVIKGGAEHIAHNVHIHSIFKKLL